jgi:uncharacterized membrane protein YccC
MLSTIIGTFEWPATAVVVGVAIAAAIAFTAWLQRTPRKLQEMKLQTERDVAKANIERDRDVQLAKLNQNLITSHREEN